MDPHYIYLRPGLFSVVGFTYGKAAGSVAKGGKVKVRLVLSGRWAAHEAESIELKNMEIEHRIVTAKEALDGAESFVRSAICISRLRSGGSRVWDYGLVVGYKWDPEIQIGRLDVNFGGATEAVEYAPDCTQDVGVYALQSCTSLVVVRHQQASFLVMWPNVVLVIQHRHLRADILAFQQRRVFSVTG
ncbi:Multidrug resistance protein ABC transporter [Phytophthora megakarya]|uniref:Multidrug resistance protein ABC transporter n=1 Tax=Phytophthora megakarya TaxID=4795 RepID=A0A225UMY3_9STRA|nr:Multidrug resistance protein ABC transporter [Phytophthora megakarya]